ncbi:MAG TPA: hypothetical protein DIT32_05535 [Peptococcaceae bacterium]|nr:hypothetical protein [Peptococcaceae bacterium]
MVLGDHPAQSLQDLVEDGVLIRDDVPAFYIYEQIKGGSRRLGFLTAVAVTPYEKKEIVRHEKTFEEKVLGRIKLMTDTGYVTEPVWLLSRAPIGPVLEAVASQREPVYAFESDFNGVSELHGIHNRIFKVEAGEPEGQKLMALIGAQALYIADGHHRYHSALRMGLDRCIAYICEADAAQIQAYNRVIRGKVPFSEIKDQLPLQKETQFKTPEKHQFAIYTKDGCYSFRASHVPEDPVGRLDCHILEQTLYPLLKLDHSMINDPACFDYYPEYELDAMCQQVDDGKYDLAVALNPVVPAELLAVADAGILDPEIVMPEKSTFFAPKILSGLFLIPTGK